METVKASVCWDGPERDILRVFVDPSPPLTVGQISDSGDVLLLVGIDDDEQETGTIAGVEVVDFLAFDRWDEIPDLPLCWQLPQWSPLPLPALLRTIQAQYRERYGWPREPRAASAAS